MAPGAKIKGRRGRPPSILKSQKITRPIPAHSLLNWASTSNRFSVLANENDIETSGETNITNAKQPKPPPLIVDTKTSLQALRQLFGMDCTYKSTSIGTKLFPVSLEKFEACKKTLIEKKIEFHSFNSKENKLFTVFLYGLPKIETSEIIDELKSYNVIPSSVAETTTKYSSVNNAVYKVQFVRKNFIPNSLKNIKTIANVVISWRKYKQKKNDKPTQCWNCLMYGHGGEHCHRLPACMICANQHHTNQCPLNNNNKRPAVFTCFNCKKHGKERTDHSANDINCPLRAHYLEARANATSRNVRHSTVVKSTHQPNIQPTNSVSFNNNNNNNHLSNSGSYAGCMRGNNSLFSINDLFEIFTSTLEDLKRCTSKIEQMQVVMSMVRYAYEL